MCYYNIIVSYVGGEQLKTSMKATSLPSSTVDQSTREDNIIVQNIVYANSDSGLLRIYNVWPLFTCCCCCLV